MRLLTVMNEVSPSSLMCSEPSFQESIWVGLANLPFVKHVAAPWANDEHRYTQNRAPPALRTERHRAAQRGRGRRGEQYVSIMPSDATKRVSHAAELALAPWQRAKASSPALPIPLALHVSCCLPLHAAIANAPMPGARNNAPAPCRQRPPAYKNGELR